MLKKKKSKRLLWSVIGLIVLAGIEQLGLFNFNFAHLNSASSDSTKLAARTGDLLATTQIDRPFTRWLPLVKYGETIHHRTFWRADGVQVDTTSRTHLFVVGFCSTATYDEMADKPFAETVKRYARQR